MFIFSTYVAQSSDWSAFDFDDNTLASSFSVKVSIGDLVWPKDEADVSAIPIMERFHFSHASL